MTSTAIAVLLNATLSTILGVEDAFHSDQRCGLTALLPTDPGLQHETPLGVVMALAVVTAGWGLLWLLSYLVSRVFILPWLPPSTKAEENSASFVGRTFPATLKGLLVSGLAITCLFTWYVQGKPLRDPFVSRSPALEMAGVLFISYEIADLLFGKLQLEFVVHHLLHIALGWVIRWNCMGGLLAAVLMAQETTGVFLNYFLLMLHRAPNHWSTTASFVLFAICFFVFRIVLGTFGTLHYVLYYREYMSAQVVAWQAHLIAPVLVLASVLQWYWGWAILQKVRRHLQEGAVNTAAPSSKED